MKIDILFLNDEMNGLDEYFDNDLFQEYCETHSFEVKRIRYFQFHHHIQRMRI